MNVFLEVKIAWLLPSKNKERLILTNKQADGRFEKIFIYNLYK